MEMSSPSIQIIKQSPIRYQLLITSTAIHYINAYINEYNFLELNYNLSINDVQTKIVSLNETYSRTECFTNISWNPSHIGIIVKAKLNFQMGADPTIWTAESIPSVIQDFSQAGGTIKLLSEDIAELFFK